MTLKTSHIETYRHHISAEDIAKGPALAASIAYVRPVGHPVRAQVHARLNYTVEIPKLYAVFDGHADTYCDTMAEVNSAVDLMVLNYLREFLSQRFSGGLGEDAE